MSTQTLHAYFNKIESESLRLAHDAGTNMTLRRMQPQDAELIYQWQYVDEAEEHNPNGDASLALIASNIQLMLQQDNYALFIAEVDGHPIGHASFSPGAVDGSFELGYYIEKNSRHKGLGKVIAKLTSDLVMNDYDQVAFVRKDNPGSLKIIKALGFTEKQDEKLLRAQDGQYLYDDWCCFTRLRQAATPATKALSYLRHTADAITAQHYPALA